MSASAPSASAVAAISPSASIRGASCLDSDRAATARGTVTSGCSVMMSSLCGLPGQGQATVTVLLTVRPAC